MKNFVLLSSKKWHDQLFQSLNERFDENWTRIQEKEKFSEETLSKIKPDKIFIPHWSHIIHSKILENYECIIFHMTDLPYGRGGSPLQNLIIRGHKETMVSAIQADEGIDTGPIYLKSQLSLYGSCEEIFLRSTHVIKEMIDKIIDKSIIPLKQEGKVTQFKRRSPKDGNITELSSITEVFDYIRMLDCEDYPSAFLESGKFRLEFTRASLKSGNQIVADVRIIQK